MNDIYIKNIFNGASNPVLVNKELIKIRKDPLELISTKIQSGIKPYMYKAETSILYKDVSENIKEVFLFFKNKILYYFYTYIYPHLNLDTFFKFVVFIFLLFFLHIIYVEITVKNRIITTEDPLSENIRKGHMLDKQFDEHIRAYNFFQ